MKIFHNFDQAGSIKNAVVTTGSFDGVHIGHKAILQRLKRLAEETGGETVLITFDPHPRKVLLQKDSGREFRLINSLREKTELLKKAGLENLIIVNFTLEFSRITSVEFVKNILLNKIQAKTIVIGFNHHFGHNREGDHDKLRQMGIEYGFDVEEIPEQEIQHEKVSSEKIRQAILEGDIQKANAYLDNSYIIMGLTEDARPIRENQGLHGFRIRIEEELKLVPPDGEYDVTALCGNKLYRGICLIRKMGASSCDALVEFYLPDKPEETPGNIVTLFFHHRISEVR